MEEARSPTQPTKSEERSEERLSALLRVLSDNGQISPAALEEIWRGNVRGPLPPTDDETLNNTRMRALLHSLLERKEITEDY